MRIRRQQRIAFAGDAGHVAAQVFKALSATEKLNGQVPTSSVPQGNGASSPTGTPSRPREASDLVRPQLTRETRPAKVAVEKSLAQRSVQSLRLRQADRTSQLKAVDVALSEITAEMPGERKRLEILRDRLANDVAACEMELSSRFQGTHTTK